jgi:hypothetical protein
MKIFKKKKEGGTMAKIEKEKLTGERA